MRKAYQDLIHTLNCRYREQFDRAERLEAELRHIRQSRLWRLCCWLRRWRAKFIGGEGRAFLPSPLGGEGLGMRGANDVAICPLTPDPSSPRGEGNNRVSIIIPFRDGLDLLRNCLRSLGGVQHSNYEIVLIDNGSREKRLLRYLDRLRNQPRFRVLHSAEPFNFAGLCNLGAAQAPGEFLLFHNNDVEALEPDWLTHMLRLAILPEVGVVGATLLYPDRTIQHAGIYPLADGSWAHRYRGQPCDHRREEGELQRPRSVPAVTGACLLIRRALFAELGGFDERLPLTMNDVDLCCRVRERGLQVAISPDARLLHFESLSRGYGKETARLRVNKRAVRDNVVRRSAS